MSSVIEDSKADPVSNADSADVVVVAVSLCVDGVTDDVAVVSLEIQQFHSKSSIQWIISVNKTVISIAQSN